MFDSHPPSDPLRSRSLTDPSGMRQGSLPPGMVQSRQKRYHIQESLPPDPTEHHLDLLRRCWLSGRCGQISLDSHNHVRCEHSCKQLVCRSVSGLYESRRIVYSGRRPGSILCGDRRLPGSRSSGRCDARPHFDDLCRRLCRIQHRRKAESIAVSTSRLASCFTKADRQASASHGAASEAADFLDHDTRARRVRDKRIGISESHHAIE